MRLTGEPADGPPAPPPDPTATAPGQAGDDLAPTGPRRVLLALYGIFALAATARALVQLSTHFHQAPLAYLLSLLSGIVYLGATVGLLTHRRWSRPVAWASCGTELAGVLVVGVASLIDSKAFPHDTVWSRFGSGYGYFPLLLPVLGLMYLSYSRPAADLSGAAGESGQGRRGGEGPQSGEGGAPSADGDRVQ